MTTTTNKLSLALIDVSIKEVLDTSPRRNHNVPITAETTLRQLGITDLERFAEAIWAKLRIGYEELLQRITPDSTVEDVVNCLTGE